MHDTTAHITTDNFTISAWGWGRGKKKTSRKEKNVEYVTYVLTETWDGRLSILWVLPVFRAELGTNSEFIMYYEILYCGI